MSNLLRAIPAPSGKSPRVEMVSLNSRRPSPRLLAPMCRSGTGSNTPITQWLPYGGPRLTPTCRSQIGSYVAVGENTARLASGSMVSHLGVAERGTSEGQTPIALDDIDECVDDLAPLSLIAVAYSGGSLRLRRTVDHSSQRTSPPELPGTSTLSRPIVYIGLTLLKTR